MSGTHSNSLVLIVLLPLFVCVCVCVCVCISIIYLFKFQNMCIWRGISKQEAMLQYQMSVLQFISVLILCAWRYCQIPRLGSPFPKSVPPPTTSDAG